MKLNLNLELLLFLNGAVIIASVAAVTALLQVDNIVHGTLYSYGLIFSYEWASQYWTFFKLSLALLCGAAGIGFFSMFYVVACRSSLRSRPQIIAPSKPVGYTLRAKAEREKEQMETVKEERDDGVEIVAIPMACNKCGKVFTQPLCMFDFKSGKPRLVNVCPYCNALLAVSGNSKTE